MKRCFPHSLHISRERRYNANHLLWQSPNMIAEIHEWTACYTLLTSQSVLTMRCDHRVTIFVDGQSDDRRIMYPALRVVCGIRTFVLIIYFIALVS